MNMAKQKMNAIKGRKDGGFVLTEFLLAIGIIALILGTIAAIAIGVQASSAASNEARTIETIAAKIKKVYQRQTTFENLSAAVAIQAGAIPLEMQTTPGTPAAGITHQWQSTVVFNDESGNSGPVVRNLAREFEMVYNNVPSDACTELATASINGVIGVDVDGTVVYNEADNAQYDAAGAAAACGDGDDNVVTFVFGKI